MSTPKTRAERLIQLYHLRSKIEGEIALLEAAVENEYAAVGRMKTSVTTGKPVRRQPFAICGTDSGYHHHRRIAKESPCAACKLAHAAAERARKARKAAS